MRKVRLERRPACVFKVKDPWTWRRNSGQTQRGPDVAFIGVGRGPGVAFWGKFVDLTSRFCCDL